MVAAPQSRQRAARARSRAALDTALRQADALSRLTIALRTVGTAAESLAAVTEFTTGLLDARAGLAFLSVTHDESGPTRDALRLACAQTAGGQPLDMPDFAREAALSARAAEQTVEWRAARQRRPQLDVASRSASTLLGLFADSGDEPVLAIPCVADGRVVAILSWYGVHQPVARSTITLLGFVGQRLAQALAGIEAQEAEQRRLRQEMLVADFAQEASATLELEAILDRVSERAAKLTGADRANIWLLDTRRGLLMPAALYGMDEAFTREWKTKPVPLETEQLSREALSTRNPVIVADAPSDSRTDKASVAFFGDKSILVVPLVAKDRLLGSLFLNHVREPYLFSRREVGLAVAIANQAAIAIENARLFAESRRMAEQLRRSFQRIGQALAAGHELEPTLQLIVELAAELVDADACQITLLDEERHGTVQVAATAGAANLRLTVRAADPGAIPEAPSWRLGDSASLELPLRKQGAADEVDEDGTSSPCATADQFDTAQQFDVDVPLVVDGQPIGALSVRRRHQPLTSAEVDLLSSFASQASVAISNARDVAKVREAERLKTEFVGLVSHELRTPLALIKGYATTLINPTLALASETQARFLRGIDEATNRLTRLIDNLLSVTRIDFGMFSSKPEWLDLRDLVAQGVQVVRDQGASQAIELDLPEQVLWVHADRDQIQQVVENLVGNALKYAAWPESIRVVVDRSDFGPQVRVIDRGPGIPPHELDLVFEKFYRVGEVEGGRPGGTGLGLYICRKIVEAHSGRIGAGNNAEGGATFWFELQGNGQ